MKEKCPNCGNELNNKETTCPACGYSLEKINIEEQKPEKNLDKSSENTATSEVTEDPSADTEANEAIEWSELKDMSLGHVMEMFNDQHAEEEEDAKADKETLEEEPVTEELAEPSETVDATDLNVDVSEASQEPETNIEAEVLATEEPAPLTEDDELEESATVLDTDEQASALEADNEISTNETLQAYIRAHKNENDEWIDPKNQEATEPEASVEDSPIDEEPILTAEEESVSAETGAPATVIENSDPITEEEAAPSSSISQKEQKKGDIPLDAAPVFYEETPEATPKPIEKNNETSSPGKKSYKKITLVAAAALVLIGGGWAVYNRDQTKKATAQTESTAITDLEKETQKQLASYYLTTDKQFIKPEMVGVSTQPIKTNLDKLKDSSEYDQLEKQYQELVAKQGTIAKANELFDAPIIDGDKLSEANLAADKKITLEKGTATDSFTQLVNQAIDRATQQYDQLQKAKQAVAVVYKDEKATDGLNRTNYATAKAEVDKVKSANLKKNLTTSLEKADKILVASETATTQPQIAQAETAGISQTQQPETATTPAATTATEANGYSAANSSGVYTAPLYPVDANDVADMSNPAWTWNPGVKEKVIATAIQRGYVVEGGYRLEPAKIVDGEGYYNLYGTSNKSPLLAGSSDNNLNVYLVTINAKTGWFKGNASRNAGN